MTNDTTTPPGDSETDTSHSVDRTPPTKPPKKRKRLDYNPAWIANRAPRSPSSLVQERVALVESMIVDQCLTDRQIGTKLSKEWGLTRKSIQSNYISRARRNLRERANLSRTDAKGMSLETLAKRWRKYGEEEAALIDLIGQYDERVRRLESEFDAAGDPDTKKALAIELDRLGRERQEQTENLRMLRVHIHGMRDRMDRIYGVLAPIKIAETDANGDDRPRSAEEIKIALVNLGVPVPEFPEPEKPAITAEFRVSPIDLPQEFVTIST